MFQQSVQGATHQRSTILGLDAREMQLIDPPRQQLGKLTVSAARADIAATSIGSRRRKRRGWNFMGQAV